jgi:hypothetical protein
MRSEEWPTTKSFRGAAFETVLLTVIILLLAMTPLAAADTALAPV